MGWRDLVPEMEERLSTQAERRTQVARKTPSSPLIPHIPHIPDLVNKGFLKQEEEYSIKFGLEEPGHELRPCLQRETPITDGAECQEKEEKEEKVTASPRDDLRRRFRVVRWAPKQPPILLTRWSVVTDTERFAFATIEQLRAALEGRNWLAGNWSVAELLDRLETAGVTVELNKKVQVLDCKRRNL